MGNESVRYHKRFITIDDYLSIEHIIIALFESNDSFTRKFIKFYMLNKKQVLNVINEIRGGNKVNNQTPENNYEVLELK